SPSPDQSACSPLRSAAQNSILLSLGLINSPIKWLSDSSYIVPIVVMVQLWQSMGVSFLANISGLQNINPEIYEAGSVDGIKNRWQELWYITLPGMSHMLLFSAVMQIASSFSISSIITQLAGYPTVGYVADTIVSYLSDVGTVKYEMGYASALSVVLFLLMIATRGITKKLLDKVGQ
ncbi:MAG: carbohydrate ABC transporter permease, partial [Acutalibacteraceae bacterium]